MTTFHPITRHLDGPDGPSAPGLLLSACGRSVRCCRHSSS
jgi:hypothetical protein